MSDAGRRWALVAVALLVLIGAAAELPLTGWGRRYWRTHEVYPPSLLPANQS
jgi:hypothetical protein